eukprot:CAMPEP_0113627654 /NCGR_PEP_ID=MMETSP0017_2-20120614/14324_1 /TAXON_ID=2856 /ORGANISM="Cylindrotheca closterium" /LENGTH=489 /DNA_ID=CAMNT_0000537921 /DNA_START=51 /DNA_END=1517 /DNA_ORIENTATION=- /assembly_acc=CAM_ASM_000147
MCEPDNDTEESLLSRIKCRPAQPTDILQCLRLEKSWNPSATKNDLQYRQHHAAPFFRCTVLEGDDDEDIIVGFICGIRIDEFRDQDSQKAIAHRPLGTILMIRSMVVAEEHRREGLGTHMLTDYLEFVCGDSLKHPVSEVAIVAKQDYFNFFLTSGFSIMRPLTLINGKDQQYLFQKSLEFKRKKNGRECYIVDSFAAKAGTGNPAGVVLLPEDSDEKVLSNWMQTVAAEFNLSETAFCWPRAASECSSSELHWNIRFYTPTVEVALCGHATLASAAVLYQILPNSSQSRIVFHALEDQLTMKLAKNADNNSLRQRKICMEFPAKPPIEITANKEKAIISKMMKEAFSCKLEPLYVGLSEIGDILVEVTRESFGNIGFENLNYSALLEWDGYSRGIIVCSANNTGTSDKKEGNSDFVSRFFGPKAGINEDPVTGSAHCALGPYFASKLGKDSVVGKQMSARGGFVECVISDESVQLTGTAITAMSGVLW